MRVDYENLRLIIYMAEYFSILIAYCLFVNFWRTNLFKFFSYKKGNIIYDTTEQNGTKL